MMAMRGPAATAPPAKGHPLLFALECVRDFAHLDRLGRLLDAHLLEVCLVLFQLALVLRPEVCSLHQARQQTAIDPDVWRSLLVLLPLGRDLVEVSRPLFGCHCELSAVRWHDEGVQQNAIDFSVVLGAAKKLLEDETEQGRVLFQWPLDFLPFAPAASASFLRPLASCVPPA